VEAFKAVSEKRILCPVNWRNNDDNMVDTSFVDQDHQLALDLGELKVKNLDDNTVAPLPLAAPSSKRSGAAGNASTSKRNSTVLTRRNSNAHSLNTNVVKLDFADLLETTHNAPSTHEYINLQEPVTPENAQSSTGMQRTVETLKRISGGWTTPLGSPLSEPVRNRKGTSTPTECFDQYTT
jgi:hypothetical protein